MTALLSVQKGVPMPEIDRSPKGARRKYPVDTMAVGDMFFVQNRTSKSVSAYISRITKNLPGKFTARHCWMRFEAGKWVTAEANSPGAVEGAGVWRLE